MVGSSCVVIARHFGVNDLRESFENELAQRLCASGAQVVFTPHLYHLPHQSSLWSQISSLDDDPVGVVGWINSRPLECLLREYAECAPRFALNLSDFRTAEAAAAAILEALGPAGAGEIRELEAEVAPRWYPLIDRTRCTSCRHCLQFCLFGVYDSEDRRVVAVSPDSCKDGCPACARVCPEGAIIFPLSDEPAIAGSPGTIMEPDAAARRMYYVRTGRRCPVCGEVAEAGAMGGAAEVCDECGRPLDEQPAAETSAVHAEIDSLIDALDELAAGGGGE